MLVCVGSIRSSVTGLLAFAKTIHVYANIKNVFINLFWFKYIFPTKFEIIILDKMLLQKKTVSLLRGYTTVITGAL